MSKRDMDILDETFNLIGSIAKNERENAKVRNQVNQINAIAQIKDGLADENRNEANQLSLMQTSLNNTLEDIKTKKTAFDKLNLDISEYFNAIPADERSDDMKGIFSDSWDGQVNSLKMDVRTGSNLNEQLSNMRGSIQYNNNIIQQLDGILEDYNVGLRDAQNVEDVGGLETIVDYFDYADKAKNNPRKYYQTLSNIEVADMGG